MLNLSPTDILASLDLPAIEAAILGPPTQDLLSFDYEDAKKLCVAAAEKWLLHDLSLLSASSVQLESEVALKCGGYKVKGFIDLKGVYKTGAEKGKKLVVDWKSSESDLDLNWQNRLVNSWQMKTYAVAEDANFVAFRGISRKLKTREVFVHVPPGLTGAVNNYYTQIGDMMRSISSYDTWPRNMPSACGMYGTTCPFQGDCMANTMPRYQVPIDEITLSFSGTSRFLSCPEKYRRIYGAERGIDGSESTRLGSAIHRGLEAIWSQSFAKYGED